MRLVLLIFVLLGLASWPNTAHAAGQGCPGTASPDRAVQLADRLVAATQGQPLPGKTLLTEAMGCHFNIELTQLPDALHRLGLTEAGGSTSTPLAFGDLAFKDGHWLMYLYGEVEVAVNVSTGEAVFMKADLGLAHVRMDKNLELAWRFAARIGAHADLAAQVKQAGVKPRLPPVSSDEPPEPGLDNRAFVPTVSFYGGYLDPFGYHAGRVALPEGGGGLRYTFWGWRPLETQVSAQYTQSTTRSADELALWHPDLNASMSLLAMRVSGEVRVRAVVAQRLELGAEVGPAALLAQQQISFLSVDGDQLDQSRWQLSPGAVAAGDLCVWLGAERRAGLAVRGGAAVFKVSTEGNTPNTRSAAAPDAQSPLMLREGSLELRFRGRPKG